MHDDPVDEVDPTGLFSVAEVLTVSGIKGAIGSGVTLTTALFRVYNTVTTAIKIYDYAKTILRFAHIIHGAATPTAAAQSLVQELKKLYGLDNNDFNANDILNGFRAAADQIGNSWRQIAQAIVADADRIAADVLLQFGTDVGTYTAKQAAGRLQFVFFAPTGPEGRTGRGTNRFSTGNNNVVNITDDFAIAFGTGGGRLFGFGVRIFSGTTRRASKVSGIDQWFRIDWHDGRLPAVNNPNVHYHVGKDRQAHPPSRAVIWQP